MIKNGDYIVAGVSGGADSVCLLFLLCELRTSMDLTLSVVHVNHGIRSEAGRDEEFVRNLCEKLGVEFTAVKADIPNLAKKLRISEEEAGRKVRYEAFDEEARKLSEKYGCDEGSVKIAVAHNMNDNAETVLFRMFRGTGIKGMAGIPAAKGGRKNVIRPLLGIERSEIEEFLRDRDISWVEDETNGQDIYSRNRIRHNILPEAEEIAPEAARHIAMLAEQMEETEEFLSDLEEKAYKETVKDNSENLIRVDIEKFSHYHPALKKRILHRCLREITSGGKDLGSLQISQLLDLADNTSNRQMDLARGITASREYGDLIITVKADERSGEPPKYTLIQDRFKLSEILEKDPAFTENLLQEAESNKYTKWFDYDKIYGRVVLRTRQAGDFFLTKKSDGSYGRKSLKDYMIDQKIPPSERDEVLLAAIDDKILWVVGYRISDDLKIGKETVNIVRFTLKQEN